MVTPMPAEKTMPFLRHFCLAVFLILAIADAGITAQTDPLSAACLSCHDGSEAIHVNFCLLGQNTEGCGGHIISAAYTEFAMRDKSLLPESELPPAIVLFEGKITCITCHGNYPHEGEPLAINNRDSALCQACHLK